MKVALEPWALDFANCIGPRYLILMGGRGSGKSHGIGWRGGRLCTSYPKFHWMYISPVSDGSDEIIDMLTSNSNFMKHVRKVDSHKYPIIKFKNKSSMKFRSFQRPRGLRGKNLHECVLDEIQDPIYTSSWIEGVINPMVRGASPVGNRGTIVMAGQFGQEWVKRDYYDFGAKNLDDGTPNPRFEQFSSRYRSWRVPASEGFIYQGEAGRLDLQNRKDELIAKGKLNKWNQEYECIPTASEYAAFPADQLNEISIRRQWMIRGENRVRLEVEDQPRHGVAYVVIADPGRTTDPTAVLVGDQFGNIICEEVYPLGQPHAVSARNAAQLAVRFNSATLVCAANEFIRLGQTDDSYVKAYREAADTFHLDFHAVYEGGNEKRRMADNFTLALQRKDIAIAKGCGNTLTQLKAFQYAEKKKSGGIKHMEYGGPVGTHDDLAVCAIIYVEAAVTRQWAHLRGRGSLAGLVS